jgi:hypothetical protein
MADKKKDKMKVRDLKPNKDAKGGGGVRASGGGGLRASGGGGLHASGGGGLRASGTGTNRNQ